MMTVKYYHTLAVPTSATLSQEIASPPQHGMKHITVHNNLRFVQVPGAQGVTASAITPLFHNMPLNHLNDFGM